MIFTELFHTNGKHYFPLKIYLDLYTKDNIFSDISKEQTIKLLKQGFLVVMLKSSILMTYDRYHHLVVTGYLCHT